MRRKNKKELEVIVGFKRKVNDVHMFYFNHHLVFDFFAFANTHSSLFMMCRSVEPVSSILFSFQLVSSVPTIILLLRLRFSTSSSLLEVTTSK
jgi:hypothetical protein